MKIDTNSGLIDEARFIPSPNHDQRETSSPIDLIVIHNISLPPGEFGGPYIEQLFTNQLNPDDHPFFAEIHTLKVSAHLLIRRDGELVQFVPFHHRAWHAGVSCYDGRERCNDFSIGIELEGSDDTDFCDAQYEQLSKVTQALLNAYPTLSSTRITGHSDIAPGRKTDPGPHFDWQRLSSSLPS